MTQLTKFEFGTRFFGIGGRPWKINKDRLVPIFQENGNTTASLCTCAGRPFESFVNTLSYPLRNGHIPEIRLQVFLEAVEAGWSCDVEVFYCGSIVRGSRSHHFLYVNAFKIPDAFKDREKFGYIPLENQEEERKKCFPRAIASAVERIIENPPHQNEDAA